MRERRKKGEREGRGKEEVGDPNLPDPPILSAKK